MHPICPVLTEQGLFAFIVPGPKLQDLRRDTRYALHTETFPPPRQDDAFFVSGAAIELQQPDLRAALTQQFLIERDLDVPWPDFDTHALVEFEIARCLLTLTSARNGLPSGHTTWNI